MLGAGTTTRAGGRWRADARRAALSTIRYEPRTREQRLRETMTDDGWAGMSEELFEKVLEVLQPAGPSKPNDGAVTTIRPLRYLHAGRYN